MEEFESAVKRKKTANGDEKVMYDNSNRTEGNMKKAMNKKIGGQDNKRNMKAANKTRTGQTKVKSEEETKAEEQMKKLKNYYNQLRVKQGDLKPNKDQKKQLIDNCLELINDDYSKLVYKHDGCRVLQCMIKNSNVEYRTKIISSLMEFFAELLQQKYSHHLALKMVENCPNDDLHKKMIGKVVNRIGKFINHVYGSEVIEALYSHSKVAQKQELLTSFYGEFFLILRENSDKTIKELIDEKPMLRESIISKLETLTHKLIDKGMSRHTIVQAIIYDYVSIANDEEKQEVSNLLLEVFPSLLNSEKGLQLACGLFTILSSKERRTIIKTMKPLVEEMAVNPISSVFLIYVCLHLDDTVQSKKSIVNTLVKNYEDICDQNPAITLYSVLLTGLETPVRNIIHKDTVDSIKWLDDLTTSKKSSSVRRKEILGNIAAEISSQTESTMIEDLMGKHPFIVLSLIQYAIEYDECDEYLQALYRNLNKEITSIFNGKKVKVICDVAVHRHIKNLVIFEVNHKKANPDHEMHFSAKIADVLKKDLQRHLTERSVFILAALCQNDETKKLITKDDITKKMIKRALKDVKSEQGLKFLTEALYPGQSS